jgi:ribosomal protein S18 acetylase RimI-like enzyme
VTDTTPARQAADPADRDVLARIDRYFDRLPLLDGHAEELGPVVVFVRDGAGPPRSAKPLHGRTVGAADVAAACGRLKELGLPESFEWVHEAAPTMRDAARAAGLALATRPLLVLPDDAPAQPSALPADVEVRVLAADDPCLLTALATPRLAFADIGMHVGSAGAAESSTMASTPALRKEADRVGQLIGVGLMTVVAAVRDGVALCSGLFPGVVDGVAELCAIATLPAARRQGLASAVTEGLAAEARRRGAGTVFLSATDDSVARLYERAGFRRVGTFLEAEPAPVA